MLYICIILNINTRPHPNEKTHLIVFFFAFSRAKEKGRCRSKRRRCQRNGTHQSTESNWGSRNPYRLHSRYQYGSYRRWSVCHRLYYGTIGQHGTETRLDIPVERPYQTKCHVIDWSWTVWKIYSLYPFHQNSQRCCYRRTHERAKSGQPIFRPHCGVSWLYRLQ